jgi:hypothetical protein
VPPFGVSDTLAIEGWGTKPEWLRLKNKLKMHKLNFLVDCLTEAAFGQFYSSEPYPGSLKGR